MTRALVPVATGLCLVAAAAVIASLMGRQVPPLPALVPAALGLGVRSSRRCAPDACRSGPTGRSLIVDVDPSGPVPAYEQIRTQLATMITAGVLGAGDRLPSVRQLAGDLGLAVNTVARAYRELQAGGFVVSRVRHGTTVAERRPSLSRAEIWSRLADAARAYAIAARQLGASADEAEMRCARNCARDPRGDHQNHAMVAEAEPSFSSIVLAPHSGQVWDCARAAGA